MQAKELRDRVQQALIYPAFLAFAGAILVTIFITFMVPQLTGFMAQTGGAMPLPTRILLQVHHMITGYWWLGLLILIGVIVGFRAVVRTQEEAARMGPVPVADSGLRPGDSTPLLRAVCAYVGDFNGERRAFAAFT